MDDCVIVKSKVSYVPFDVPKFAFVRMPSLPKKDGMQPLPRFQIEDLDDEALDMLAMRWLDNLFASANRESPFRYERPARVA